MEVQPDNYVVFGDSKSDVTPISMEMEDLNIGNKIFAALNEMRQQNVCCDACLRTEDGSHFPVHKIIMATCSSYFRTLFTTPMKRTWETDLKGTHYITIPNVSSAMLDLIIRYAYTGRTDVGHENVVELLAAADQFNVDEMVEACAHLLLRNMERENCLGIWRFARCYFCPDLEKAAWRYIMRHFPQISTHSEEFLDLPLDLLKEVLTGNDLNARTEQSTWESIVFWCNHSLSDRLDSIPELLACVRLAVMPLSSLQDVAQHYLVANSPWCRQVVAEVARIVIGRGGRENERPMACVGEHEKGKCMFTPRRPTEVLLCFGGWIKDGPSRIVEAYDWKIDAWKMIQPRDANIFFPRAYHKSIMAGEYVYIMGGTQGVSCLQSCMRLHTKTLTWEDIPAMAEPRCYLCAAVLGHGIYAIGGFNGTERLQSVEMFDLRTNRWSNVAPMNQVRSDACACTVRDRIIVTGGFNGREYLDSVEFYVQENDQWYLLPPMLSCRSGVTCLEHDGHVYALGGYDGTRRMNSVEKYNLETMQWSPVPPMMCTRSNFTAAIVDNKIYVIGGYDNEAITNEAECFDFDTQCWKKISPVGYARSALSCCVLSELENTEAYLLEDEQRCLLKRWEAKEQPPGY